ncbi:hypothetical protein E2C01_001606 [Portunus trituberculatus]|uniref:Uncharacterized protein n=1 Tax=Portunus trituberculatus TaxID=210409 RepID=A0A5B7CHL6_PORTR|nr:hypothetical protein [Portunus trituberculatus]
MAASFSAELISPAAPLNSAHRHDGRLLSLLQYYFHYSLLPYVCLQVNFCRFYEYPVTYEGRFYIPLGALDKKDHGGPWSAMMMNEVQD